MYICLDVSGRALAALFCVVTGEGRGTAVQSAGALFRRGQRPPDHG
jgi:hypothetical protein